MATEGVSDLPVEKKFPRLRRPFQSVRDPFEGMRSCHAEYNDYILRKGRDAKPLEQASRVIAKMPVAVLLDYRKQMRADYKLAAEA